jgi:hypothetical protein
LESENATKPASVIRGHKMTVTGGVRHAVDNMKTDGRDTAPSRDSAKLSDETDEEQNGQRALGGLIQVVMGRFVKR